MIKTSISLFLALTSLALVSPTVIAAEVAEEEPLSLDVIEANAGQWSDLEESIVADQVAVSDFEDVSPEHWAFRAIKNLTESHPILKGAGGNRFEGNRPLSRYEFAVGLRSFLGEVDKLITENTDTLLTRDEFNTLEQLRLTFATELSILKGKIRSLELRTAELEAKQFSTTTKVTGNVVMAINGVYGDGILNAAGANHGATGGARLLVGSFSVADAQAAQNNPNIVAASNDGSIGVIGGFNHQENNIPGNVNNVTFITRTRLSLTTNFNDDDSLEVRLSGTAGTDPAFATYYLAGLSYGGDFGDIKGRSLIVFDKVQYSNLIGRDFRYFVGPALNPRDIVDRNSFSGNDISDFSSTFFTRNRLLLGIIGSTPGQNPILEQSPGMGFDWQVTPSIALRAVYNAGDGGSAKGSGRGGLFGDLNQLVGELEIEPARNLAIRFQFSNYTVPLYFVGIDAANEVVQPEDVPLVGNATTNVFALNAEWAVASNLGLFARYGTAETTLRDNGLLAGGGTIASNMWQVGFSLLHFGGTGNLLGVAVGQPTRAFAANGSINPSLAFGSTSPNAGEATPLTPDAASETDVELFYKMVINDNLSITPDVQVIFTPHGVPGNPTLINAVLRTVFTF